LDAIPENADISKAILAQMLQDQKDITTTTDISEIFSDRIVAGLELITPRVVTDTLIANSASISGTLWAERITGGIPQLTALASAATGFQLQTLDRENLLSTALDAIQNGMASLSNRLTAVGEGLKDIRISQRYQVRSDVRDGMIVVPGADFAQMVPTSRSYDAAITGVMSVASVSGDIQPVVISGRVRLRVVTPDGPIRAGDRITSSDVPGAGMRATGAGMTVGVALEPLTTIVSGSYGDVLVFVQPMYWAPEAPATDIFSRAVAWLSSVMNITLDSGLVKTVTGMFDSVKTKELCVGDACVTQEQFMQMIQKANATPTPTATPTPAAATVPIVSDTPVPTVVPASVSAPVVTETPTPTPTPMPTVEVTPSPVLSPIASPSA